MAELDDKQQIRQWSDSLAAAWERHRKRLFESQRQVSDWLVDHLDPKPSQTILELAAGPGETGFLAAERVEPGGTVISTDIGQGMVRVSPPPCQTRSRSADRGGGGTTPERVIGR